MSIIILEQNGKARMTNEDALTQEYRKMYQKSGSKMDTDDFYYEFCAWDAANGEINFDQKKDEVVFNYTDWTTEKTYSHIETCISWLKEDNGSFDPYVMSHVLMALYYGGPLGKTEYDCLHDALCNYD